MSSKKVVKQCIAKQCIYCGEDYLIWENILGSYKLVNLDGDIHECAEYKTEKPKMEA